MNPVSIWIIDHAPRRARPAVELVVRTIDDAVDDRLPGLAAEVAFFVLLSLPPLLLTVFGTLGLLDPYLGVDLPQRITERTVELASGVFSQGTIDTVIQPIVASIFTDASGRVATIGFVVTVYSASRALRVVATAITIAYDLEETRPGWQQRVWGLGLTLAGILLGLVVVPVIVAGPDFGRTIASGLSLDDVFATVYSVLYWPVAGVVAWLLLAAMYHFVAPWWTPFRRDLPGAALAMMLWLVGSLGLRAYVSRTIGTQSIYEPIAGPLVLLLWLYVSGFAVLLGAELNAEIERMWPSRPHQHVDRDGDHDDEAASAPSRIA